MALLKRYVRDEQGYTLIEMLAVLLIISVISFIVFHISHKKLADYTFMQTIDQIALYFSAAQIQAIDEECVIYLEFNGKRHFTLHNGFSNELYYSQILPEGMEARVYTNQTNRIGYNTNGNIKQAGNVKFTWDNSERSVQYTINIGRGRWRLDGVR